MPEISGIMHMAIDLWRLHTGRSTPEKLGLQ
jgi:hypothetical protein